ncbi:retinol dehydrogenase 12 [Amniculicola lignicola CBS 123094]|uniref:Retinol dehydrogenase 12 n=1 Tax=Amniculicola lignicola CBS 123094 TaxID=1392246 RepID=A0A6A5WQ51_9PLEO|nr:retinol dehydrogenase 12 [Amniculicola lignicola CBS 123094]
MGIFILTILRSQFFVRIPYPTSDFSGQTIIVTGSNTGLGLEAARHIVRLGASKVILAVRTVSKGEAAAEDILNSTKATKNTIEVWPLDLSDHESIKKFATRAQGLERLDALLQNAGVLTSHFKVVAGEETHIAVNTVSAVLLGLLVLPKLRETSKKFGVKTRLSFVGSDLQWAAKFNEAPQSGSLFDALRDEKIANMGDRYATSKLLLLYAVREIAARSPNNADSEVIINFMTPGACKSDLFRDEKSWLEHQIKILASAIFARTTEVGGRTLVDSVRPDLPSEAHGAFLMDCKIAA